MRAVSDSFLLTAASIAATLLGLLLLGVFYYVETGLRRAAAVAPRGGPFLQATTRMTILLYTLVLAVALGLVVLEPVWFTVMYALLALALIRALVTWTARYRGLRQVLPIPRESPWLMWPAVVGALVLPWVLGGWEPQREAMAWTLLLAGGLALAGTAGLVLTSFDLARWEEAGRQASQTAEEEIG
jgi:hypothetical protein